MNTLIKLLDSRWYWVLLAIAGTGMIAVALYYQYVLGDEPCQVCIQARIWVFAFTLVAIIMAVLPAHRMASTVGHLLVVGAAYGLWNRSKYLYDIENGLGDGSCEFQLGMPDWFALDRWFPDLFEVRNLCSYTPEVLFGLSMAESLLIAAAAVAVGSLAALAATWWPKAAA